MRSPLAGLRSPFLSAFSATRIIDLIEEIITDILRPAMEQLVVGQSISDTPDYAAMIDPANYQSTAGTIASVAVSFQGDATSASFVLSEGETAGFAVRVMDSDGNGRTFGSGVIRVPYIAPVAVGSIDDLFAVQGSEITPFDVTDAFDGTDMSFELAASSDALPAGIAFSEGAFSGTPTSPTDERSIIVRATNPGGHVDQGFSIDVVAEVAPVAEWAFEDGTITNKPDTPRTLALVNGSIVYE